VFELLRGEMVSLLNGSSVKIVLVEVVSVKVMLLEGVSIGGGSTQRGVRASAGTGKVRFGEHGPGIVSWLLSLRADAVPMRRGMTFLPTKLSETLTPAQHSTTAR
jgi:hypothetical protein